MTYLKRLVICFYILMIPLELYAQTNQQQFEQHYFFDHYPSSWTEITQDEENLVEAASDNFKVQARINMQNISKATTDGKTSAPTSLVCSNKCLSISVNAKQIIVPCAVDCDLGSPLRAKILIKSNKAILLINTRDGDFVKIEFDKSRVLRKRVYADGSLGSDVLWQEIIYHHVIYK